MLRVRMAAAIHLVERSGEGDRGDMNMATSPQIDEIVSQLVQSHFETETTIDEIVWLRNGDDKEIRLIEINRETLPSRSVEAFYFAPSKEVPLPVRIADVTPGEWQEVQSGSIPLPVGWTLGNMQVFRR